MLTVAKYDKQRGIKMDKIVEKLNEVANELQGRMEGRIVTIADEARFDLLQSAKDAVNVAINKMLKYQAKG